jgi:gallate decarboxylase subunit D
MAHMEFNLNKGEKRNSINIQAVTMGDGLVVRIFNENAHIGAVSIGEYDFENLRASVSVITRLGHKDDAIAQRAAYLICKSTQKTVCAIAGVHLDNISPEEIKQIIENATYLIEDLIRQIKT